MIEEMNYEKIERYLGEIEELRPMIHCLTNEVTVNDVANCILAIGGSPTMAHAIQEVEEISGQARGLLVNLGASEYYEQILKSSQVSSPVKVLDPVGIGASTYRRSFCKTLLTDHEFAAIRGNFSEIQALVLDEKTADGVDRQRNPLGQENGRAIREISSLSKSLETVIIASGEKDIITDGDQAYLISNGSGMMSRVTGMGCMASGILTCFLSVENTLDAVLAAHIFTNLCGEYAEERTRKNQGAYGTFHLAFLDALSLFSNIENMEKFGKRPIKMESILL